MTEERPSRTIVSRRTMINSTATALASAAAALPLGAQKPCTSSPRSPADWLPKPVKRGGDANAIAGAPNGGQHHLTSFINNETGLTSAKLNHKSGWAVQIKPSGYRGIPIYTVHDLRVNVDGRPVDISTITFVYNNTLYRLDQLKDLRGMQWWVFDWATLFVEGPMESGEHEIEIRMKYANTYVLGEAEMAEKVRLTLNSDEVALLCL